MDEDAEAVKAKAREERMEEDELQRMTEFDKPKEIQRDVSFGDGPVFEELSGPLTVAHQPEAVVPTSASATVAEGTSATLVSGVLPAGEMFMVLQPDPGLQVPQTPQDMPGPSAPISPRNTPTTRAHAVDVEEGEAKRAKVEDPKKQRIERLMAEQNRMIRTVSFGDASYHTLDSYEVEFQEEQGDVEDPWKDEDELYLAGVREQLWSDHSLDQQPPPPDAAIDALADELEINRLLEMKVLVSPSKFDGVVQGKLTTKFVRDWRKKVYVGFGDSRKRWMRRSRLVAREYAITKRDDTFSPATGAHTSNLLPLLFLERKVESEGCGERYKPLLASLDIKDAFLQVPQAEPTQVDLRGTPYVVLKNLPGQRQGSKEWYWYFRKFLEEELQFTFCSEQPCLARVAEAAVLMHVDDLLFCGSHHYFHEVFLPKCQQKFTVNFAELGKTGSNISFLKKKIIRMDDGILVTPGIPVARIVEAFEESFGPVRGQVIPCDNSIQLEDVSQLLSYEDASSFRSVVGMALYLGRDRPDAIFTIKEVASRMSKPTVTALQHLRKLVGYLKQTGDIGVKLQCPQPGQGKWKTTTKNSWVLETYSDADWAGNKAHRKSTSCGMHFLNGSFLYGSSRTQRVVSLSSCESELHSIVSAMSDAIFVRRCIEFVLQTTIMQVHYTDSSSARQLVNRQGVGKIRHLSGKILWVQHKTQSGEVMLTQIPTAFNIGDIGTKCLAKRRLLALMGETGMFFVESREQVGQTEQSELVANGTSSKTMTKLAKTLLRLTVVMGLEPTTATAQEEICKSDAKHGANDGFAMYAILALMVFLWLVFACTAVWFWKRLQMRLYWNELQQAETDSFMGGQRDMLENVRRHVQRVDDDLRNHVDRWTSDASVLEDSIDGLRFGLSEIGGFVRYNELSREQRASMMIQERANMVMHDMRRRAPESTDPETPDRPSGTAVPTSSVVPRAVRTGVHYAEEQHEEESPTDDEMGETGATANRVKQSGDKLEKASK